MVGSNHSGYSTIGRVLPGQTEREGYKQLILSKCKSEAQRRVAEELVNFKFHWPAYCSLDAEYSPGSGRVDLFVEWNCYEDRRLPPFLIAIEIDDDSHLNGSRYRADLERDRKLIIEGYHLLRYFWQDALKNPAMVVQDVQLLLSRLIKEQNAMIDQIWQQTKPKLFMVPFAEREDKAVPGKSLTPSGLEPCLGHGDFQP